MVASRFYIAMVGVRFPLKVQNIYIGGIGIQRLKARAQVIHQKWLQVRILYINLLIMGLMSTVDRLICNQFDLMGSTPTKSTKCLYKMPVYANW